MTNKLIRHVDALLVERIRLLAKERQCAINDSGRGGTAFVMLRSSRCKIRFSAIQYALLSSLSAVGRVFLGSLAAWRAPRWGGRCFL